VTALTPAQLAEAEALCAAATKGPWAPEPRDMIEDGDWRVRIGSNGGNHGVYVAHALGKANKPNAAFIAASRTLVPALISHARQAEARAVAAEGEVERLRAALRQLEQLAQAQGVADGNAIASARAAAIEEAAKWHDEIAARIKARIDANATTAPHPNQPD